LFSLLSTIVGVFLSWYKHNLLMLFYFLFFFCGDFQLWNVLTSGKDHGAVLWWIKAVIYCCDKLLWCWIFPAAAKRFTKSRSTCKTNSVYVIITVIFFHFMIFWNFSSQRNKPAIHLASISYIVFPDLQKLDSWICSNLFLFYN